MSKISVPLFVSIPLFPSPSCTATCISFPAQKVHWFCWCSEERGSSSFASSFNLYHQLEAPSPAHRQKATFHIYSKVCYFKWVSRLHLQPLQPHFLHQRKITPDSSTQLFLMFYFFDVLSGVPFCNNSAICSCLFCCILFFLYFSLFCQLPTVNWSWATLKSN